MEPLEKLLLYAAAGIGLLAPIAAFLLFQHTYRDTWSTELQKYQALAGAFVALFAASLGTLGVLLNIRTQRRNTDRQISAQRREQDRGRFIARQQVASAFIGEISVFIEATEGEGVRPTLIKTLNDVDSGIDKVEVTTVRLSAPMTYYLSSPGNVGLFPHEIPEELTRFYNRAAMVQSDLEKCASAAEQIAVHGKLPATTNMDWIVYSLKRALTNLDLCLEGGRSLVRELGEIRNAQSI
jgi:hypothetical protein